MSEGPFQILSNQHIASFSLLQNIVSQICPSFQIEEDLCNISDAVWVNFLSLSH